MKEIEAFSNKQIANKNNLSPQSVKEGDKFYYKVVDRLGNNKYLVDILGKRITATINEKVPNNGVVKVVKAGNELILKIVKENTATYNKNIIDMVYSASKDMLASAGISASSKNIDYLNTVLKYMDNLSDSQKKLLLNYISKNNMFTVNDLEALFDENVYIILLKSGVFSKIPKTKPLYSENYRTLINSMFESKSSADVIKNSIESNGYLALLLLLLDNLSDEDIEISRKLKLLIYSLSANRRNKALKDNIYYLQIPINIDNSQKDLKLFIETDRDSREKLKISLSVFDNNSELCNIDIEKEGGGYNIIVKIFEKNIYNKYVRYSESLLKEIEDIKRRTSIEINIGVVYES